MAERLDGTIQRSFPASLESCFCTNKILYFWLAFSWFLLMQHCSKIRFFQHLFLYLPLMKFFAFILSFYFLALSCFPCGDVQECNAKEDQKISISAQHEGHDHQTEDCTAFCSCGCCAVSAFYQPIESLKIPKPVLQSVKFEFEKSFISNDLHSIWQPPRLV